MTNEEILQDFEGWHETHFEITSAIAARMDKTNSLPYRIMEEQGTGGLYELAKRLTDEFQTTHKEREWDGEYFEEIEDFANKELE